MFEKTTRQLFSLPDRFFGLVLGGKTGGFLKLSTGNIRPVSYSPCFFRDPSAILPAYPSLFAGAFGRLSAAMDWRLLAAFTSAMNSREG